MRLFVAILPPPEAGIHLEAGVGAAQRAAPELRWGATRQWHLTLTFLAEVADSERSELEERLARACRRHPPLRLRLAGGGSFGNRVLFTRVEGDRAGLRRLAASTTAAARRTGLAVDDRPYRPHLTLARSRSRYGSDVDLRPAADALGPYRGPEWTASALHLVHSRLAAGPGRTAVYETVQEWMLSGASPRPSATSGPAPSSA